VSAIAAAYYGQPSVYQRRFAN